MHRRNLLSALPVAALVAGSRSNAAAPATCHDRHHGGEIDGTFMRVATDLTSVINSPDLRVVPIVGRGRCRTLGTCCICRGWTWR